MNVTTIGIDLAKNTFSVCGCNAHGKVLFRKSLQRDKLFAFIAQQPPCLIGMEACSGAHHWARLFQAHGHTIGIMAPKFVTPFRKGGKNDGNDAVAIAHAVSHPEMHFVAIKSPEQQAGLCLHRLREGLVQDRTAQVNRLRGLLSEFGIIIPQDLSEARRAIWLGLTPRQFTTGGKTRLGRITKQGDVYLRTLLIHGARSVVARRDQKEDAVGEWIKALVNRAGFKRTAVALAAKQARVIWAIMTKHSEYTAMA